MPGADTFLADALDTFRSQQRMAERAMAQLPDDKLHVSLTPETNSVAVIVKHMMGNMRSRWTDFLTSDGEKPDRHRDDEFVDSYPDRAALQAAWAGGWAVLLGTLARLTPADLDKTITIRGQPHSVPRAILRQVDHYGYHTGQIVLIARIIVGESWQTLTIPRGGSQQFNQSIWGTPR